MTTFDSNSISWDRVKTSCRLCLSVNCKLYQLFRSDETETSAVPLSMKVTLCTAVAISKQDKMSQKICQNCLNYVNDWYLFRKKCMKINCLLKEKLLSQSEKNNINEKSNSLNTDDGKNYEKSNVEENSQTDELCSNEFTEPNENVLKNYSVEEEDFQKGRAGSTCYVRKKKFKCNMCPDSFYYVKDLKLHRTVLHNCGKSSAVEKAPLIPDADIKLEGINMRTRYEMKCCNKVFFNKLKFRRHYNEKHPGEKPYMCETCGKKDFISEETLKRHKVLHTGKFRCEICSKTFTCNAILILHKRDKHENDKPFICDVCGKRFVTELLMNYHKRFHTGEKKYVCEECGLAVVTSSSLAKHKRIHSKEKPHVCHVCGKGFIIKGRLVEHLRVHTGERPFECEVCQKGFTMRDKLKRHMRVHSGEKHFSCEYCGNNYSTRYGLSVHLKTHLKSS